MPGSGAATAARDSKTNLFRRAGECLRVASPERKIELVGRLCADWHEGRLTMETVSLEDVIEAGMPERVQLVHPRHLRRRSIATDEGRLALIHAVAHIEFNAINLACDAVFRFQGMPADFYRDWLGVAREEGEHFNLLRARLRAAGRDYGDFPAHSGLWDMARRTAHDLLARMAMVPRMLEARGLDVTPRMISRLRTAGDQETADVLEVILRDEVGHVRLGSYWFHYLCERRGADPEEAYFNLLDRYLAGEVICPLHVRARIEAGFSPAEIARLERRCRGRGSTGQ